MLDFTHFMDYIVAAIAGWVGYLHRQLDERPTREEIILRDQLLQNHIDEIKEDLKEIKSNVKDIRDSLK